MRVVLIGTLTDKTVRLAVAVDKEADALAGVSAHSARSPTTAAAFV